MSDVQYRVSDVQSEFTRLSGVGKNRTQALVIKAEQKKEIYWMQIIADNVKESQALLKLVGNTEWVMYKMQSQA